ncbi:hypothetical protein EI94DRAFT_1749735 [Lactarius quietus]|nr:hypothetical protein EI94DRAFT_1749735 [Lactarius quietus]
MADGIFLFYLVEGNQQASYVSVSYNSNGKPTTVDDLRKTIFNDDCKHLAHSHKNLTLFKIDVDPGLLDLPLPLLRFSNGDEGVEELSPWRTLGAVWREPPSSYRIHIFVTFTNLSVGSRGQRSILEAAYLVHNAFWREGLDKLLQTVPGCNLKYLSKEHINSLKLKHLSYGDSVLLVREEYEVTYRYLQSCADEVDPRRRRSGMIVTGHPGIGKSCFLYYLLFRLLSMRKNVAFQVDDQFLFFEDTGVQICNIASSTGHAIPDGTWTLTDSHTGFEKPCGAFLTACGSRRTWLVQTTAPSEDNWRTWKKEYRADIYWMDVITLDELNALGKILHPTLDIKRMHDIYNSWGPSARNCIWFAADPELILCHEHDVVIAAFTLTNDTSCFTDFKSSSVMHDIFVVRPSPKSRRMVTVDFGTNRLREIVTCTYAKQNHAGRQEFYKTIRGDPLFSSLERHLFKIHILLWFWHARTSPEEHLMCNDDVGYGPQISISACPGNLKFFSRPEDLQKMDHPTSPMCLVPTSPMFPTIDAVVLTDSNVITVHITIAPNCDSKEPEFDLIYDNIPADMLVERPGRYHVFITDREFNAKSLLEQKPTQIPKRTKVCATVVDIGQLDSKALLVTEERVKELEKVRAASEAMDTSLVETQLKERVYDYLDMFENGY